MAVIKHTRSGIEGSVLHRSASSHRTTIRVLIALIGVMSAFALSATAASAETVPEIAVQAQQFGPAPVSSGLSLGGLLWLPAGLIAISAGFVAATRSVRTSTSAANATASSASPTTIVPADGNNFTLNGATK